MMTICLQYHCSLCLGSFFFCLLREVKNILHASKRKKKYVYIIEISKVIWNVPLIIWEFIFLEQCAAFQHLLYHCINQGTDASCPTSMSVPMEPILLPSMAHKGSTVSFLFLTALMSHQFWKKMAQWLVLIALPEPRASVPRGVAWNHSKNPKNVSWASADSQQLLHFTGLFIAQQQQQVKTSSPQQDRRKERTNKSCFLKNNVQ